MTDEEAQRFRATLTNSADGIGIHLDDFQQDLCLRFTQSLLEMNGQMNLTRITEPDEVAIKHFADSLTVLKAVPDLPPVPWVIDVGTGAGFPGVALKIARPAIRLTLLDSLAKRLAFLSVTANQLGMKDVETLHSRAEDAGRRPDHRDTYHLVTARAVAALPTLLEWCGPLVRVGGKFVAMKGADIADELSSAENAIKRLGLRLRGDHEFTLPATGTDPEPPKRHILVFEKVRETPARYPRTSAEIKAHPL